MRLSIVSSLYCSESIIEAFCERATAPAQQIAGQDYEIILVDDGSPDTSLKLAIELASRDTHISVIELSRNFGHHQALLTGLQQARGDLVFLIDSDLEEDPAWLTTFHEQMELQNCDAIYGVQNRRKGGVAERAGGALFYFVARALNPQAVARNATMARLMRRPIVDAALQAAERNPFLPALILSVGFDQRPHAVEKRSSSPTSYSLRKIFALFMNGITSVSSAPLAAIFLIGLCIFTPALVAMMLQGVRTLFDHAANTNSLILISVWLLGGLLLTSTGIIGLYLSKALPEIRNTPTAIIRKVHRRPASQEASPEPGPQDEQA